MRTVRVRLGEGEYEVEQPVHPIPIPCSTYTGRTRCGANATHWLVAPDGKLNPGGYVCWEHSRGVVEEFREKVGEEWGLVEISWG